VDIDRALRRENAGLLADTIAAYRLFDAATLPELAGTEWREAWYSVRLTYDTTRLFAFVIEWSEETEVNGPLAETYYGERFGTTGEDALRSAVVSHLLRNLASNVRALWVNRLGRTLGSKRTHQLRTAYEIIDTGADSLKPWTGGR